MEKTSDQLMNRIHSLSNERLNLYRKAGESRLDQKQIQHIHDLTGQLAVTWDEYRRELASEQTPRRPVAFPNANVKQQQAA
ncbi:hypothetical protein G4Y79_07405 [Phototrophicus methaneseepsis]|uniref:Uncharacterized protein n=1 Tax=Phototrophicus methaneseepsis TaxID=2710758 RepID=A0A7S8EBZ8_9CHLR|nr:hypothetical protein [Phototrophicus methaneseepsis]QPC84190.1 hypothetical protein G4Y79_07405 [Phototrophicus methaneseepsis]